MTSAKVGDRVIWGKVPDGALVRLMRRPDGLTNFFVRRSDRGWWVGGNGSILRAMEFEFVCLPALGNMWPEWAKWHPDEEVTIIEVDLPAGVTAALLSELAEQFAQGEQTDEVSHD